MVNTVTSDGIDFIHNFDWSVDKIDVPVVPKFLVNRELTDGSLYFLSANNVSFGDALNDAASRNTGADGSVDAVFFKYDNLLYVLITIDEGGGVNTYNPDTDIVMGFPGAAAGENEILSGFFI